jgi:hypothetical protein
MSRRRPRGALRRTRFSSDYALWYGWSEMVRDLRDIREMAADMGHEAAAGDR